MKIWRAGRYNSFRVCYSFHSSYEEIRDLVMFLRPRRVFPNVAPGGCLRTVCVCACMRVSGGQECACLCANVLPAHVCVSAHLLRMGLGSFLALQFGSVALCCTCTIFQLHLFTDPAETQQLPHDGEGDDARAVDRLAAAAARRDEHVAQTQAPHSALE